MHPFPVITVVLALLLPVWTAQSHPAQEDPERLAAAAEAFAEARAACEADGGALWGRPLWGQFMLVDPATRRFVASEAIEEAGDGAAGATTAVTTSDQIVHVGTLPESFSVANTAADYAGRRWAMALWPLAGTPEARRQLLCHELWHRVQDDLGLNLEHAPCEHLDEEQGRLWLRLEMRALAAALRAGDDGQRARAVADALAFRARRGAAFEGGAEAERSLEITEGLAEYTGLRLSGRADLREAAAQKLDSSQAQKSLVRSFAYATGPAYGLLLDAAEPGWQRTIRAGDDLGRRAAKAFRIEDAQPISADDAMARYDGDAVRDEEREGSEVRAARRRVLIAQLVEGPVLEVPMKDARASFDPNTVTPLPPHGTVYPAATLTAPWGTLEAKESEVLIDPNWQKAFVPAAAELKIAGDGRSIGGAGWTLRPKPGWRVESIAGGGYRVVEAQVTN